jgi:heme exporter protein A
LTPPAEGALLEALNLSRSFGRRPVLRGVSLALRAGDIMVVLGPNGAGKSTLLRVLSGLLRPATGEVRWRGTTLRRGDHEARRRLGLLAHQSFLYDDLTLLENLVFAARLYGLRDPQSAAMAALAEAGVIERAGETPRALSRGAVQRAAVARAFIHDPEVVLLDEPFTGLDASAAQHLRDRLRQLRDRSGAALLVTHHPAEVWELTNRVGVIVEGRLVLEEPRPEDLTAFLRRYQAMIRG